MEWIGQAITRKIEVIDEAKSRIFYKMKKKNETFFLKNNAFEKVIEQFEA